jgi:putative Mg2+ transporter-C (MgtC) family protein
MDLWQAELFSGVNDPIHIARVVVRLILACLFGAVLGFEREAEKKAAGLRTHMLVALGAALFTLTITQEPKMTSADLSRIIQGIAAGIGFLGAGCILKLSDEHRIQGLTSAAGIWLTAAVGSAIGAGWFWPALAGVFFGWIILYMVHRVEHGWKAENRESQKGPGASK